MTGASPGPNLYLRVVGVPPGAPWDQWRAARLDALHGAPLDLQALHWSVRQLEPWRLHRGRRFAIGYVRRDAIEGAEQHIRTVEGQVVRFAFGSVTLPKPRRIDTLRALAIVAAISFLGVAGHRAWNARLEKTVTLERLEAQALATERLQRREKQSRADAAAVRRAALADRSLADVLEDLSWLGANRAPTSTIRSVAWEPEGMTVQLAGTERPVPHDERPAAPIPDQDNAWWIGRATPSELRDGVRKPSIVAAAASAGADQ